MKTLFLLFLTFPAYACIYTDTENYTANIAIVYEKIEISCNQSISPLCASKKIRCFQRTLIELESRYDCPESALLVVQSYSLCKG